MEQKNKRNYVAITGILSPLLLFVVAITTSYVDNIQAKTPFVIITILAVIITFVIVYKIIEKFHNKSISNRLSKCKASLYDYGHLFQRETSSTDSGVPLICPKHGYYCCAEHLKQDELYNKTCELVTLSEYDCKTFNLVTDTDFDDKESHFFESHPKGEIWIISYCLETEIKTKEELSICPDESLEKSMEVVKHNIERGGRYTQFVALGPQGERDTVYENRCRQYWSAMPNIEDDTEKMEKMPVIRIDSGGEQFEGGRDRIEDPDWEYMVRLTSTVLFVDNDGKTFVEGYFCFRPDDSQDSKPFERRTVLFRMPNCMRDDYYYFLRDKKNEYFETQKNKKIH